MTGYKQNLSPIICILSFRHTFYQTFFQLRNSLYINMVKIPDKEPYFIPRYTEADVPLPPNPNENVFDPTASVIVDDMLTFAQMCRKRHFESELVLFSLVANRHPRLSQFDRSALLQDCKQALKYDERLYRGSHYSYDKLFGTEIYNIFEDARNRAHITQSLITWDHLFDSMIALPVNEAQRILKRFVFDPRSLQI
jgi:hypothetical protein